MSFCYSLENVWKTETDSEIARMLLQKFNFLPSLRSQLFHFSVHLCSAPGHAVEVTESEMLCAWTIRVKYLKNVNHGTNLIITSAVITWHVLHQLHKQDVFHTVKTLTVELYACMLHKPISASSRITAECVVTVAQKGSNTEQTFSCFARLVIETSVKRL